MSVETDVICDLPVNAAVTWIKRFLGDAESVAEVQRMLGFCESDCFYRLEISGESVDSTPINQILWHLRDEAHKRTEILKNLEMASLRVRERLR